MEKTFYNYMLTFTKEDSPRGLLARDMQYMQERSPRNTDNLNEITTWDQMLFHLREHNAWWGFIEIAELCWHDYENRDSA